MNDLFSFGRVKVIHLLNQLQRFLFAQLVLLGVKLFGCFDLLSRKKLLRLGAGLSAGSLITPINRAGHLLSFDLISNALSAVI